MTRKLDTEAIRLNQMKLAKRVRSLRKARQMSQSVLAALCRIHVSHLSKIERGNANPTLQTLTMVADALATTPSDLLAGTSFSSASTNLPGDPQSHADDKEGLSANLNSAKAKYAI